MGGGRRSAKISGGAAGERPEVPGYHADDELARRALQAVFAAAGARAAGEERGAAGQGRREGGGVCWGGPGGGRWRQVVVSPAGFQVLPRSVDSYTFLWSIAGTRSSRRPAGVL